ncbi:hypothetical protein Vretifemale_1993 [Volvox reticuliferus]|nr:hypothetical protein Vretifemale_1993 [Volvox reticuliferus]
MRSASSTPRWWIRSGRRHTWSAWSHCQVYGPAHPAPRGTSSRAACRVWRRCWMEPPFGSCCEAYPPSRGPSPPHLRTSAFWEAALPFALASPPNVSTHCFYSYGLRTAVHVTYARADFSDTSPMVRYDDGDLTVPHASLVACRGWAVRQVASVRSHSFFGVVHGMLTSLPEALEDILDAIAGEAG